MYTVYIYLHILSTCMTCTSIWFNKKNRCGHFMCFVRNPSCFPIKNPLISVLDSYPKFAQTLAAPVNCGSLAVIFLGIHGTGMVPKTTRFQIFIACFPWFFLTYDSQIIRNPTKNDTLPKFNSQNPWSFHGGKGRWSGAPIGLKRSLFRGDVG